MGGRLHCASVYKVHNGYNAFRDINQCQISRILFDACNEDWLWWSGDDMDVSSEFEIDRKVFKTAISNIREMSPKEYEEYGTGYSQEDFVHALEMFERDSDQDNNFIHFTWF